MKNIKFTVIFLLLGILVASCGLDIQNGPIEKNTTPPGPVTNIEIENMPGKVRIRYDLPSDKDLLYVKAEYQLYSGQTREVKASYYENEMVLDGFRDESEYEVNIYSVNRSEVASEPLTVKVYPLENPIWTVRKNMKINGDFSGVNIRAENPEKYDISIELVIKEKNSDEWKTLESIHSSAEKINLTRRGLDTLDYTVGATVRDRFLNYTDTVYADIKPFYEEVLNKALFSEATLPNDAPIQEPANLLGVSKIWDGDFSYTAPWRLLTAITDTPQWVTFNIGQKAYLSRMKLWNYGADPNGVRWFFYQGHLRKFRVWGTLEPNPDGSWDNWTCIGEFEVIKPSGLPAGEESNEDFEAGVAGFDFDFISSEPVRYVRIECVENWEGSYYFDIKEITLYGQPVE